MIATHYKKEKQTRRSSSPGYTKVSEYWKAMIILQLYLDKSQVNMAIW